MAKRHEVYDNQSLSTYLIFQQRLDTLGFACLLKLDLRVYRFFIGHFYSTKRAKSSSDYNVLHRKRIEEESSPDVAWMRVQ